MGGSNENNSEPLEMLVVVPTGLFGNSKGEFITADNHVGHAVLLSQDPEENFILSDEAKKLASEHGWEVDYFHLVKTDIRYKELLHTIEFYKSI